MAYAEAVGKFSTGTGAAKTLEAPKISEAPMSFLIFFMIDADVLLVTINTEQTPYQFLTDCI